MPSGQALAAALVAASMLIDAAAAKAEQRSPGSGRRLRLSLSVYSKEGYVVVQTGG